MTSQQPLDLTEINETPLKASQIARTWKLQASNQTPENHILHIWADGINLPFKKNLDITILTPWFIDIIPEDFAVFARRLNTRLKTGTFWINFGPLGFGAPEKSNSYTADEIRDCLTHAGFEIEFWQEQEIPYLQSPLSPQHRTETVLIWRAKKTKGAKEPSDHTYYPEWMTDLNQPIPTLDEFRDLAVKSQFEAQILSAIDGKISIRSFTQAISQQSGISVEDAENLLLTYFSRWHEGN